MNSIVVIRIILKIILKEAFIDLGLMSCPIDLSKFESVEMPLKETWGVLVKKDSQLALKEFIEPQDLIDLSNCSHLLTLSRNNFLIIGLVNIKTK